MCNTRKATVNFCYMSFSFPRCYSLCRCPVLAGKRHGAVSLLQEEKEAQTSRAHDRQPGSLWFWLQSLGSPVFHHFQVQNTFKKKKKMLSTNKQQGLNWGIKFNTNKRHISSHLSGTEVDDPFGLLSLSLSLCQSVSCLGVRGDRVPLVRHPGLCVRHRLFAHHLSHLCGPLPEDLLLKIRQVWQLLSSTHISWTIHASVTALRAHLTPPEHIFLLLGLTGF